MSQHCFSEGTLEAYARMELDADKSSHIESHLEGCEHCCMVLSKIVDTTQSLTELADSTHANTLRISDSKALDSKDSQGNPAYRLWARQPTSSSEVPVPSALGRYRIEKLIGSGGFGHVFQAMDDKLDRKVAIKVPRADLATQPQQLMLIQAEARTVASLDHPNIVPIYDVGSTEEIPLYFVTKLIDGHNLAVVAGGGISLAQAVGWVIQIADALSYAHEQCIIHRDVKPQNILVDGNGQARLTDFGLAWRTSRDSVEFPNAGTPAYMSPEQLKAGETIDHRTDIYSLGKVLQELVEAINANPHEPGVEDLLKICARAVSARPDDRFSHAAEFAQRLRDCAREQGWPVSPSQHGLSLAAQSHNGPWSSAIRWRVALILLLICACGLAASAIRQGNADRREQVSIRALFNSAPHEIAFRIHELGKLSSSGIAELEMASQSEDIGRRVRAQLALIDHRPQVVQQLVEAMLVSHVDLATLIANQLIPHKDQIKQQVLASLLDESKPAYSRLNASSFLAAAYPKDPLWDDAYTEDLLTRLFLADDLQDLQAHARAHFAVRAHVTTNLRRMAVNSADRSSGKSAHLFDVWEALVQEDLPGTVTLVIESNPETIDKIVPKLSDKDAAKREFHSILALQPMNTLDAAEGLLYRAKFMAAYALLRLGEPEAFWNLWSPQASPDLTTVATFEVANSKVTLALLVDYLYENQLLSVVKELPPTIDEQLNSPLLCQRRNLAHALFRTVRWQVLDKSRLDQMLAQMATLANHDADAGMQAQAYWVTKGVTAIELWKSEPWFSLAEAQKDKYPKAWTVNSLGMFMTKLEDAKGFDHDFEIGQREVEVRYFETFLKETNYTWRPSEPADDKSSDNWFLKPRNFVSWYDCAAFCNWLSRQEKLEECYVPNAAGEFAEGMSIKPDYVHLSGYRLPTNAEWTACCRAGTNTRFSCGDLERFLVGYGWCATGSRCTVPTGHLPPNRLGLFDVHGNVSEWTIDDASSQPLDLQSPQNATGVCRGGDFQSSPIECACDHLNHVKLNERRVNVGFRLARTIKPANR